MDETGMIYLNHHRLTKVCQPCAENMKEDLLSQNYDLEKSYHIIYDFLGISYEDHFMFNTSWKEAIDQTLLGIYFRNIRKEGKTHIIAFNLEGTPIRESLQTLEELGVIVHLINLKEDGTVDLEALKKVISPRTALICFSWANGFNGVIQPMEAIEEIAQEAKINLYVDISYVLGKMYLPLNDRSISYATFFGNSIHAPQSSAGIFMKKGYELPFLNKSVDLNALVGFSIACQQSLLFIDQMGLNVARLRNLLETTLIRDLKAHIYGKNAPRLSNVSCVSFEKVHTEPLLYALEKEGVFVEKIDEEFISFSLSRYTTKEEIEKAAELIFAKVKFLQSLSVDL